MQPPDPREAAMWDRLILAIAAIGILAFIISEVLP
jgi:hypothetical protein